jgi:hypothetical protein
MKKSSTKQYNEVVNSVSSDSFYFCLKQSLQSLFREM